MRHVGILSTLIAAAVAWVPSNGSGAVPEPRHFVRVREARPDLSERLGLQPRTQVDYGSFLWLEVGAADLGRLIASGAEVTEVEDAGVVGYGDAVIEPDADPSSGRPKWLAKRTTDDPLQIIQLVGPPRDAWLAAIRATGARVLQYLPHHAYLVWLDGGAVIEKVSDLPFLRWRGRVVDEWRLNHALRKRSAGPIRVEALFVNDSGIESTLDRIEIAGGTVLGHRPAQPDRALMIASIEIDASELRALSTIPTVAWIEPTPAMPMLSDERSNAIVAGEIDAGAPLLGYAGWLADLGFDGSGVTWAVVDSGVDPFHPDLNVVGGRNYPGCETTVPGDDPGDVGHGTPVAGIIAGTGDGAFADPEGFSYGLGVAPGTSLFSQNALCGDFHGWPPDGGWQQLSADGLAAGAIGVNNSWTSQEGMAHGYQLSERTFDFMVRDGDFDTAGVAEPYTIVFSVHNDGPDPQTIQAPSEAKNIISVGSTQNARAAGDIERVSDFSGRGPAVDGRIVPIVVAPGEHVISAMHRDGGFFGVFEVPDTDGLYLDFTGTSAAAPHVSGAVAIITEWWRHTHGGADPSPAMAKALLVRGAVDVSGEPPVPNFAEGWGRIHLGRTIRPGIRTLEIDQRVLLDDTGQEWALAVGVDDPTRPLVVTLAWTDAPGAPDAVPALVNDLDLEVTTASTTFLGNVFAEGVSVPGGDPDALNNLEKVLVTAPGSDATIVVRAVSIAGDGVPGVGDSSDQDFALTCSNCVRLPPPPRHAGRRVGGAP